jgi:chaperonin GroES
MVDEKESKIGSIYVPDSAQEKPQMAKVVAVGEGGKNSDGKIIPMSVKKGDTILFGKYAGTELKHESKEYLLLSENDVLAIVE